ncbi:hypothetical protein [Paenibacillus foliorum]|nr:hypothetical protein [Paenibacillus foliorum]
MSQGHRFHYSNCLRQADEMMVIAQVFDHKARLRSYEIVVDIVKP